MTKIRGPISSRLRLLRLLIAFAAGALATFVLGRHGVDVVAPWPWVCGMGTFIVLWPWRPRRKQSLGDWREEQRGTHLRGTLIIIAVGLIVGVIAVTSWFSTRHRGADNSLVSLNQTLQAGSGRRCVDAFHGTTTPASCRSAQFRLVGQSIVQSETLSTSACPADIDLQYRNPRTK